MLSKRTAGTARISQSIWFALFLLTLHTIALPETVHAITINMAYSDDGTPPPHEENPSWDPAGVFLKSHFQRAKSIWEALLPGPGDYQIIFKWDSDIAAVRLGQTTSTAFIAFVEMNPNKPWFVDPTPNDDSEFAFADQHDDMQVTYHQRTYGQLSSMDQTTYFPGSAPPSALETLYRGFGSSSVPSESGQAGINAATGNDLLSTIVHEMGHVLGVSGIEPGEYNIDPQHVGGITDVLVLEGEGGHLAGNNDVPGFLMCDSCGAIGVRRLPTATDVLVIAEDQGISEVHLARVGRTSSGVWTNSTAWLTNDVPDSTQGAYITGVGPVTLDVDPQITSLGVNNGSSLDVQSHQLKVDGGLTLDGGTIAVSSGGLITAYSIIGDPAALSTQAGSLIRFNTFDPGAAATTSATFNGRVAIGHRPDSAGPAIIRSTFDPSSINTWNIAEELAVGDASAVISTLVIDAGAKFTSATGRLGNNGVGAGTGNVNISGAGSSWTINGALNAQQGSLNISDHGTLITGPVTMGASVGQASATIDGGTWNVSGNLEVGPSVTSGLGFGKITVQTAGQMSVIGNVNVHGTSSVKSEVIVEGDLSLTGNFNVGQSGRVTYRGGASAFEETFQNQGATQSGAVGGETVFRGNAFTPLSTFNNFAGTVAGAGGGTVEFTESSRASNAMIVNAGPIVSLGFGGRTRFSGSATASSAKITNQVSTLGIGAQATAAAIDFYENSTAGSATIINKSGSSIPGVTTFHDSSTAGMGNFYNESSTPTGSSGSFVFKDSSSADEGTFINGPLGGNVVFNDSSTAGDAKIYMRGKTNSVLQFNNQSNAGTADIDVGPATPTQFNEFSQAQFLTNSSAGGTTITVRGGGGSVNFSGIGGPAAVPTCTAANATIEIGGATSTVNTAGSATFSSASTAGNATVTANGSTVAGATGAVINVSNGGHAGNATLTANGGSTAANGATIRFQQGGFGDTAHFIVNSGASADFTQNGSSGTSVGSIEGAGAFSLGGTPLTVGNLGTSTTISGNITDSGFGSFLTGGRLNKVGIGQLTLGGTNTYSGLTTVENGTLIVNGSIAGAAVVKNGAALKGSGTLKNVSVESGGVFAPGTSPGTITVSGLTLTTGSTLEYELGATRDRIVLTNNGNVVLGGTLNLSILSGFTPAIGQSFALFEGAIGSITGAFSAVNSPVFDGHVLNLVYGTNQVMLQVGLAGDFNNSGSVDTADYVVWRKGLGTTYLQNDYNVWRANFGAPATGNGTATNSPFSAAVPEPATLVLLTFAAVWCVLWRRRAT